MKCPTCNRVVDEHRFEQHSRACGNNPPHWRCRSCGEMTLVPYSGRGDWLCLAEHQLFDAAGEPLDWEPIRV